jgi:hypothetical protein
MTVWNQKGSEEEKERPRAEQQYASERACERAVPSSSSSSSPQASEDFVALQRTPCLRISIFLP